MKKIIVAILIACFGLMAVDFNTINAMNENQLQVAFAEMNTAEDWIEYMKVAFKLNEPDVKSEDVDFNKIREVLRAASTALNNRNDSFTNKREFAFKIINNIRSIYAHCYRNKIEFHIINNPNSTLNDFNEFKTSRITKGTGSISQGASRE